MLPRSSWKPLLVLCLLLPACKSHEDPAPDKGTGFEASFEIEKTFALDFQVDDELEMDTATGALRVFPMDDKGPRIVSKVSVYAKSETEAQAVAEGVRIGIIKHGQTHRPKIQQESKPAWNPRHVLVVSYTAYVPAGTSIRMRNIEGIHEVRGPFRGIYLDSRHGDLHLQDAEGPMRLTTREGKITMRNIVGEEIEADTWSGKVDLTQVQARHLTVRTRDGDIRMEGVQAQQILTSSSYGSMDLSGLRGDLVAQNKNGQVEIIGLTAGRHEISTTHGNIQIQGATGELAVRTTTAEIRLDDFRGDAELETRSGDIRAGGRFGQLRCSTKSGKILARTEPGSTAELPWRFTSQFGEISLGLRQRFPCILTLSTQSGSLDNRVELSKILSRDSTSLRGQVGVGGQEVHLSSDRGKVEVFSLVVPTSR